MTISRPQKKQVAFIYRVEDLLNVVKVGDTVADLKRFINRWDATIAGMPEPPHENVLRDILLRQIRTSAILSICLIAQKKVTIIGLTSSYCKASRI